MAILLDTCAVIHAIRNGLNLPVGSFISLITVAELRSFAVQNRWGERRQRELESLFGNVPVLAVDAALLNEYVRIDCYSQGKLPDDPLPVTARNMGKNDLWIAATAVQYKMDLYTSDDDYDHLPNFGLRLVKVTYPKKGEGTEFLPINVN